LLRDDALVARIDSDFETAGLDARRLAILRYASRLTLRPAQMTRTDVESLREVGLADADILAVAEVTSYYAYVNRIADGLGVTLEDG
jgi:uncharacterized peroxidase-related enzyme